MFFYVGIFSVLAQYNLDVKSIFFLNIISTLYLVCYDMCFFYVGIFSVLAQYNLDVKSIIGQGYDGASNMRGEFNGLQALVSKACPQAYYIHCVAHRLQLALVAAAKDVNHVHHFFNKLSLLSMLSVHHVREMTN